MAKKSKPKVGSGTVVSAHESHDSKRWHHGVSVPRYYPGTKSFHPEGGEVLKRWPAVNGNTVRILREAKGMSKSDLAFHAGISRGTLNKIERSKVGDKTNFSKSTIQKLLAVLNVDPSFLYADAADIEKMTSEFDLDEIELAVSDLVRDKLHKYSEHGVRLSSRLIIGIDGKWTCLDMAQFFSEIEYLYNFRLRLDDIEQAERQELLMHPIEFGPKYLSQYSQLNHYYRPLIVSRMQFASPGSTDFLGIASVFKEVRIFIQYLLERKQNQELKSLEIGRKRIDNARRFVQLEKEHAEAGHYVNSGLQNILEENVSEIPRLVDEGKITSVDESGTMREQQNGEKEDQL